MSKRTDFEDNADPNAKRQHLQPQQQMEGNPYQVFPGLYVNLNTPSQPLHSIQHPPPINYYPQQPVYQHYAPPAYSYPQYPAMNAQQALHMQWKPQSYSTYMNTAANDNASNEDNEAPEVASSKKQTINKFTTLPKQTAKPKPKQIQKQKQKPKPQAPQINSESEHESDSDDLDEEGKHAIQGTNIVLDSPEDIQRWIEERRKNWPTTKRVSEKSSQLLKSTPTTTNICRYFQRTGKCRMGDKCKYSHNIVKALANHKVKIVNGINIQVPQRFTPLTNGGKSLNSLLFEGEHFKDQNVEILSVLQKLAEGGHLPKWENILSDLNP